MTVTKEKSKIDFKKIASMDIKDLLPKKENGSKGTKSPKKGNVSKIKKVVIDKQNNKSVVSLDFGNSSIKVVEGRYFKDQLKVTNCFKIEMPEATFEDGKILDSFSLIQVIKQGFDLNGVKSKDVIVTINSTQIINRELLIPVVEENEMDTVFRYEISQYLPINLNDYLLQYVVLDKVLSAGVPKLKLSVAIIPEKIVRSYYDLIRGLELKPHAFDVTFNVVGKIANFANLVTQVSNQEGTVAFVDMGAQTVDLNVFKNNNIQFTRLIKIGGNSIDLKISKLNNISIKSAVSLKEEIADLNNYNDNDLFQGLVKSSVDEIALELDRVLQFYKNKDVGNNIDQIILYGGSANIKGLVPYLYEHLNIPISLVDSLNSIEFTSNINEHNLHEYLNAIGAIIRL